MSPSLAPLPCHNHAAMSYSVLGSWVKDLSIILNGKGHSLGVSTCHSHAAKGSTWFHRFAIGTASTHVAAMVRALGLPISMRLRWPQLCQLCQLCLLDPSESIWIHPIHLVDRAYPEDWPRSPHGSWRKSQSRIFGYVLSMPRARDDFDHKSYGRTRLTRELE
jgi:hypothetical protein